MKGMQRAAQLVRRWYRMGHNSEFIANELERLAHTDMDHRKLASMGGKARAAKLSPERRKEIAKKAVAAREAKKKVQDKQ